MCLATWRSCETAMDRSRFPVHRGGEVNRGLVWRRRGASWCWRKTTCLNPGRDSEGVLREDAMSRRVMCVVAVDVCLL